MKLNSCRNDSKQTWKVLNEITGQTKEANNNFKIQINDIIINEPYLVANGFNNGLTIFKK